MGSTTSCTGSCFQWAIPPPEGSKAMWNGVVPSTRAISTSAGRPSAIGKLLWRASGAADESSCEELRKIGLLMELCSRCRVRVRIGGKDRKDRGCLLGRLANAARATGEDVDFVSLAAHDFSLGVASAFAVFWVVLAPCVMRGKLRNFSRRRYCASG